MNRNIVYPGAIPLETDILSVNRQTMIALGYLIRATVGTGVAVDGLDCVPTIPPSMTVRVAPGSMVQNSVVDTVPYGSLGADPNSPLMKMGINLAPHSFDLVAPVDAGKTVVYLIQASMQESDEGMLVLPYYNAANPVQPFSGPTNSGLPQATSRNQYVQLQLKAGVPSTTGTQLPPVEDQGWTGLYLITVSNGQAVIEANSIKVLPTAPFLGHKLSSLKPGFGSGVQTFMVDGGFVVPAQVTQVEVEVWGGGSGTYASAPGKPSGGGSGGGYARKRIAGLAPGQLIPVTVGGGGMAGHVNGAGAGAGGATSFGQYVSATGGSLNYLTSPTNPQFGSTPPGVGINGDTNLMGSAGQASILNQGGMGGGSPMGGSQNSGTTGVAGTTPGGGAAGAGTGADGLTPYDGAAGGTGLVVVRW